MATMEVTNEKVGMNIRAERVRAGLTQEELAEKVGINVGTLGNYEQGKTAITFKGAVQIAAALNINIDALMA